MATLTDEIMLLSYSTGGYKGEYVFAIQPKISSGRSRRSNYIDMNSILSITSSKVRPIYCCLIQQPLFKRGSIMTAIPCRCHLLIDLLLDFELRYRRCTWRSREIRIFNRLRVAFWFIWTLWRLPYAHQELEILGKRQGAKDCKSAHNQTFLSGCHMAVGTMRATSAQNRPANYGSTPLSKCEWIRQESTANRSKSTERKKISHFSLGTSESEANESYLLLTDFQD